MCFSRQKDVGVQQAPDVTPAPAPTIAPAPTPTKTESAVSRQQRRSRVAALRFGLLSTIKTSPQGVRSLTPEGAGKDKLGE